MSTKIPEEVLESRESGDFADGGELEQADFRSSDFSGVAVEAGRWRGADFRDADFLDSRFRECNFADSNFMGAALVGMKCFEVVFSRGKFDSCLMHGSLFGLCTFDQAMMYDVDLSESELVGASFRGAQLRRATFVDADCESCDFRGADLREADFSNANLSKADFRGAELEGAVFDGAERRFAQFGEVAAPGSPSGTLSAWLVKPGAFQAVMSRDPARVFEQLGMTEEEPFADAVSSVLAGEGADIPVTDYTAALCLLCRVVGTPLPSEVFSYTDESLVQAVGTALAERGLEATSPTVFLGGPDPLGIATERLSGFGAIRLEDARALESHLSRVEPPHADGGVHWGMVTVAEWVRAAVAAGADIHGCFIRDYTPDRSD